MATKIDRRVIRTKKQIETGLLYLLREKNIEDVTVSELASRADITRATFYQYYKTPVEVLEKIQNEIAEELETIVRTTEGGDTHGFFLQLFNYFYDNKVKAEILCYRVHNRSGYDIIGDYIHSKYMLRWKVRNRDSNLKQYDYYRSYIVFGCIAVLLKWALGGMVETPEEMADFCVKFLPRERMFLKN